MVAERLKPLPAWGRVICPAPTTPSLLATAHGDRFLFFGAVANAARSNGIERSAKAAEAARSASKHAGSLSSSPWLGEMAASSHGRLA